MIMLYRKVIRILTLKNEAGILDAYYSLGFIDNIRLVLIS
jgi:hypothetical protein